MPRKLPPPSTITPDDLWIVCKGSPRNPEPCRALGVDLRFAPWQVFTSRKEAQDFARYHRQWSIRSFVLPLTEFLVRAYDR